MERALRSPLLKYLIFFAAAILAWSLATKAFAATYFYTGGGNTGSTLANGRWEDQRNWNTLQKGGANINWATHGVPGSSDTVIFSYSGATVQIRSNVRVAGMRFVRAWTGSLLMGTGSLKIGVGGINIGSGTLVGGANILSSSGGLTQTGGIIKNALNVILSGSLKIQYGGNANPSFTSTGTVAIWGATQENVIVSTDRVSTTFKHLGIYNQGITTANQLIHLAGSGLTITGNLTITGGTLDLSWVARAQPLSVGGDVLMADNSTAKIKGNNNITLSGNMTVKPAANFTMTGGTTTLNGTNKTLSGSMTFYSLTKNVTSADTLYFYPGYTYTVAGTPDLSGGTKLLSLKSSIAASQWFFTPPTKLTLVAIILQDSNNTRLRDQICLDCTDSGNNHNWDFEITPTINNTTSTSSTSGGGGGGGGHRGTSASPTAASMTSSPAVTPPTPATTTNVSPVTKSLQKRAADLQKTINGMKNAMQKNSLQRGLDRLNKLIKAKSK